MELSTLIAQNLEDDPQKLANLQRVLEAMEQSPGTGLGGTNYVFVKGDGTPEENAIELQAKYNEAKTMPRYLGLLTNETSGHFYPGQTFALQPSGIYYYKVIEEFEGTISSSTAYYIQIAEEKAKSTRTTVVVAPGDYTFTTVFTVDTPYINIVSLTGNSDVILNGFNVMANNVYLKGLNCENTYFSILDGADNLICENCTAGDYSFKSGETTSGTFINCKAGSYSFGGGDGTASGTFINCTGGDNSFGGGGGTASGTFINCTGGHRSFGGSGGTASGTFRNCVGGESSFGTGGVITSIARLYYCRLTIGSFPTPQPGGKLVLCIDGTDSVVTTI